MCIRDRNMSCKDLFVVLICCIVQVIQKYNRYRSNYNEYVKSILFKSNFNDTNMNINIFSKQSTVYVKKNNIRKFALVC